MGLMPKGKKGVAFIWLTALLLIFTVALIYISMTRPFEIVKETVEDIVTDPDYENTFEILHTFWKLWPILVVIGVLIWAYLESMRRDPNEFIR